MLKPERVALALLLLLTFAIRAWHPRQPIVENYVGRQIPTAMVARNLDRGSGFFTPRLDTGPFPNYFLVEPPIYAAVVVGVRRLTGWTLEPSGRMVSALGMTLGAWGLFGLARRREGVAAALLAVAAFAVFPVTIRYGRAFQPDALMLGCLLAAMRCWDEHFQGRQGIWAAVGWALLMAGLALKIIAAYVLVPLWGLAYQNRGPRDGRPWGGILLTASALIPALAWYIHARGLLSEGSRASTDNAALWLSAIFDGPRAWWNPETYRITGRFLLIRSFTPLGIALAVWGWFGDHRPDRLWIAWGLALLGAFVVLVGKLHHEYYWIAWAPLVALGVGRALNRLRCEGRTGAIASGLTLAGLMGLGLFQAASTWRTPAEWTNLESASKLVRAHVPDEALVVAPEALLYAADRRGCRLEFDEASAHRAAGEWLLGGRADKGEARLDPIELIEFYRRNGSARFVADVAAASSDTRRLHLHDQIRKRYHMLVDHSELILAELLEPERGPHGSP